MGTSTAFWIPDELQERIGEKVLGVLALDLAETTHRFYPVTSAGLISHNLADHPDVYPETSPALLNSHSKRLPGCKLKAAASLNSSSRMICPARRNGRLGA